MFNATIRYMLLGWLLATASAMPLTAAAILNYETQTVARLQVVVGGGTDAGDCDTATIASRLRTREGEFFSQTNLDADLKALSLSYDRIEPMISMGPCGLEITLKIWPRPIVRSICWEGNERISTNRLREELGITVYTPFDQQAFSMGFHKLQRYYLKHGFFEAQLAPTIQLDPATNEVDLTIKICEGRAGRIRKICFHNFDKCERMEILDMIATKRFNPFTNWLTQEGNFSPEAVERDKMIILHYLQDKGYADAAVEVTAKEACLANHLTLVITATRGELYRFGNITFKGNVVFDDDYIQQNLCIHEGDPYSPEKVREAVVGLTTLYGKRGYIETYVNYEARLRPDGAAYDVSITIEEEKQYRVGLIKIFGNDVTQNSVILHEVLMLPGEVFNIEKLRKAEQRLLNIGYFKSVNVYAAHNDGTQLLPETYRDIHIEVEETTTGHLGFSLGYSTIESAFGEVKITERNFNYKGLGCIFSEGLGALRGGGEYAHLSFTLGNKARRYGLSWTKPYFMDSVWSVGFDVERSSSRYVSNEYDIEATRFTLHAGYEVNAFMRFNTHYRLSGSYVPTDVKHISSKQDKELHADGIVSAVGVELIYDSTNGPVDPTCGFRSRGEFEVAGLGGKYYFLSFGYLNSYYVPIGETGVLQLRADFKFIEPFGPTRPHSLPLDERYFLGGDQTVRGYRPYNLGPKFDDDAPRGGISLQYYSIEYTYPLLSRVDLFTFVDAGQLSDRRFHFGGINVSAGYGARLKILPNAPPLTLGMGYPIGHKEKTDIKRFFLTVGGRF